MTTWVMRNGELVDKNEAPPLYAPGASAPGLIRDGMDATWHPATGGMFDSKSEFRKATKAAGCQEVGDQKDFGKRTVTPQLSKADRVQHIKQTIEQLKSRR